MPLYYTLKLNCEQQMPVLFKTKHSLDKGIQQWGNLGALVSALHTSDYELIKRSLVDVIIEPERSALIPYFDEMKQAATAAGALGSGISGSGPSIFTLSKGKSLQKKYSKLLQLLLLPLE